MTKLNGETQPAAKIELRQSRFENGTPPVNTQPASCTVEGKDLILNTLDLPTSKISHELIVLETKNPSKFAWLRVQPNSSSIEPLNFVVAGDESTLSQQSVRLSRRIFVQAVSATDNVLALNPEAFGLLHDRLDFIGRSLQRVFRFFCG